MLKTTYDRIVVMHFLELLNQIDVIDRPFVVEQIGRMCIEDKSFAGRWFNG